MFNRTFGCVRVVWNRTLAARQERYAAEGKATSGVDLGVQYFAVTSDGERITNSRHLERKARNLARYQRRLARCQKGSADRIKATAKPARAHRKVRNADVRHPEIARAQSAVKQEPRPARTGIPVPRVGE